MNAKPEMCSNYFAKTTMQLPKTIASNRWNDKTQYQQLNIWPRKTAKSAERVSCAEDNNHGRFFNMESDDILEVWKQSPNKHTLGFYGISSELPKTEALLFNRLIAKCLNKANDFKELQERRTPTVKRLTEDPKAIKESEKISREPCNRLVLNTPLLAAKVFAMPTVQRNLKPNNALALLHSRKKNEQSFTSNAIQNKDMLKVALEDLVAKQKGSPRKKSNLVCECKQYKQDTTLCEKAFKLKIKKVLEQDDPEPENYEELYVQLLQCFDYGGVDPMCEIYEKCCRKKRDIEKKRAAREEREVYKRKWEHRERIQGSTERYGKGEKNGIKTTIGKGVQGVGVKPHNLSILHTPSMYLVPNSILKITLPNKPSKSDDNYGSGDGPRTDTLVDKKKKDKKIQSAIRRLFKKSKLEKILEKKHIQMKQKEENSKETPETQNRDSFLRTRNWRTHFKRPYEPAETHRRSIHSPEIRESLLSPRRNSSLSPGKNDHSIVIKKSIDRPVLPPGKVDKPSVPSGKTDRPIVTKRKIEQPILPTGKIEQLIIPSGKIKQSIVPLGKIEQPNLKQNDDKRSINISRNDSVDMILKQHRNRKQHKKYIHHPRKKKNLKEQVPKPIVRNCPCKICESLKRNSDTTLIRNLKAEKNRRQLCDYYKRLRYSNYIRDEPSYPAPQHKCDPIKFDNWFYCNSKWQQNCDCLNAIQELQRLLMHSTAKNDVHCNLETLKKSILRRLCNSLQ